MTSKATIRLSHLTTMAERYTPDELRAIARNLIAMANRWSVILESAPVAAVMRQAASAMDQAAADAEVAERLNRGPDAMAILESADRVASAADAAKGAK